RAFRDVHETNRHLWRWCVETAGRRVHGTTKRIPLEVFDQVERAALLPVPPTPWELAEWKKAKLHPDCHVVFAAAYYSAPHRLIGERLWVRATAWKVELFHEHTLVATHRRARAGQRRTLTDHLPPDKAHFLMQTPAWCRERATRRAAPRPPLDHLLPRPRCRRREVHSMELTHQLTPMLRTLRLSGILETLEVRNRQAVEQQSSFVEFLTTLLHDEVERRAQS